MKNFSLIILLLFLINIFFIFVIFSFDLGRPILNVDYLLLSFFFFKEFKRYTPLLFIIFLYLIDILLLILQIFPFIRLTDLVYLSSFIFNGPIYYIVIIIIMNFSFFILFFIIKRMLIKAEDLQFINFIFIITFGFFVILINHLVYPIEKSEVYARFDKKIVGSQVFFFIKNRNSSFVQAFNEKGTTLEPSRYENATQPLFDQLSYHQPVSDRILLVVNESWGETQKKEYQEAIIQPILEINNKFEFINYGAFEFVGATVSGEIRELCRLQPTTFNLSEVGAESFKSCLGNQLYQLGYKTSALHGAMSGLYDRSDWYPKAGFLENKFYEDFKEARNCKSFSGKCDVDLFHIVKKDLLSSDKSFVYWLTLNTHAPYDDYITIRGFDCNRYGIKESTETCRNFKLQYQFFSGLSEILNDPRMKGVEVFVVGDHSPPIFNIGDNFFSFKGSNVAWLHFKIK